MGLPAISETALAQHLEDLRRQHITPQIGAAASRSAYVDEDTRPEPDKDETSDAWQPTAAEALDELRSLMDAFNAVRPDQMNDLFYVHAYNQLATSVEDLLNAHEREH